MNAEALAGNWRIQRLLGLCAELAEVGIELPPALQPIVESDSLTAAESAVLDALLRERASALLGSFSVADEYESMTDFWDAFQAQEQGLHPGTIWDTYENGHRRRLEAALASAYGSEDAVLVNSGMMAVFVAAAGYGGIHGAGEITGPARRYFETTELLATLSSDGSAPAGRVALLEPIVNAPTLDGITGRDIAEAATADVVVVDNSMLGHAFDYKEVQCWLGLTATDVVVVESVAKYLSGLSSAGVVYGRLESIARIRDFARRIGALLSSRSAAAITATDIALARARIEAHIAAAQIFSAALDPALWIVHAPHNSTVPQRLRTGALVFTSPAQNLDLDDCVARWRKKSLGHDHPISIRAGFGWPTTTARAYGGTRLNQSDAPAYLRISVGPLSSSVVRGQAEMLNTIATEALERRP